MIWLLVDSSNVGGIERHVATLAGSLERRGIAVEVVLYADHGPNPWREQLSGASARVRVLDGTLRSLVTALRRVRPDLLHTHGYKAGVLGRLAARLAGVPVVSTFHSGERPPFPVNVYFWLDRWTSFLAARRISVSEAIRARVPFRSTMIPSYVVATDAPPVGPLPRRIGFVGRLSAEKAPDLFCEMARRAPAGLEWHMWGDGPMRARLEAEHGDLVRFHGAVADLSECWTSIGALLMPSRFEGLPLAALEALAAGVPVLASRVGGLPTIVEPGTTGWLHEAGDIDGALADLARWRALDEATAAAMRRACHAHVRANFSESRWLPEMLAVYASAGAEAIGGLDRAGQEP